jgi:hypothetical protein
MLTTDAIDRLEAQARAQQGREIGTGVFVTPGELLALIAAYRGAQCSPAKLACDIRDANRYHWIRKGLPAQLDIMRSASIGSFTRACDFDVVVDAAMAATEPTESHEAVEQAALERLGVNADTMLALRCARRAVSHLDTAGCDTSKMPEGMGNDLRRLRSILDDLRFGQKLEPEPEGWIIGNAAKTQWRTWGFTGPEWTSDRDAALRFARRIDAEAFSTNDEDAWAIQLFHAQTNQL